MKIVLIGYMASGKSIVGRLLAKQLKVNFIDLDSYIESKEHSTISLLFAEKGEIYFRKKEFEYLSEILNTPSNFVLSLGGGTPCFGTNMKLINSLANAVYLKSSIHTLTKRLISGKVNRPLVANIADEKLPEFIGKHLFERSPFYEQAKTIIQTDNLSTSEVVAEIIKA